MSYSIYKKHLEDFFLAYLNILSLSSVYMHLMNYFKCKNSHIHFSFEIDHYL